MRRGCGGGVEGSSRRSWGYWGERMGVDGSAGSVFVVFLTACLQKISVLNQFISENFSQRAPLNPGSWQRPNPSFHLAKMQVVLQAFEMHLM